MALTRNEVQALGDPELVEMKAQLDNAVAARPDILEDLRPPLGYPEKRRRIIEEFALEDADKAVIDEEDAYRETIPDALSASIQNSQTTASSLRVRWGALERFETAQVSLDESTWIAAQNPRNHTFTGLNANTEYNFWVRRRRRHPGPSSIVTGMTAS